jgi:hypothetical protein
MIPTYPYVTPTPHKKQKLGTDSTRTPSKVLSVNIVHPAKVSLTKKKKLPMSLEKNSPSMRPSMLTSPVQNDPQQEDPKSPDKRMELAAIVDEAEKKYNRKNKSLGLLAESFLSHFTGKQDQEGNDECQEIMVDRLSIDLSVERRRIYDVVNILEALQVIVKIGKNTYHWMGRQHLPNQFALLQNEAIEAWPEYAEKSGLHPIPSSDRTTEQTDIKEHATGAFVGAANLLDPNSEGSNKSLTRLSQLFLQAFLVCNEPLSLPQASDLIHGGRSTNAELLALGMKAGEEYPTDEKRIQQIVARGLKTKIRRLYDIANVFLSVGLLRKSENRTAATPDGKRPQFCLNYHLSIHDIRSLYRSLPQQMVTTKSPFSEDQLMKLKKTTSVQPKVKYFGLSIPTEPGTILKGESIVHPDIPSPSESSPPMTKNPTLPHTLIPPDQTTTESSVLSPEPSTLQNSEGTCYVKEAAILSYHSSLSSSDMEANENDNVIGVESPFDHPNSSATPLSSSKSTDEVDRPNMKFLMDESSRYTESTDDNDMCHDTEKSRESPVVVTVSPHNSSTTSMDVLLLNPSTTMTKTAMSSSSSPASSSSTTSSVLSPRRVSMEK